MLYVLRRASVAHVTGWWGLAGSASSSAVVCGGVRRWNSTNSSTAQNSNESASDSESNKERREAQAKSSRSKEEERASLGEGDDDDPLGLREDGMELEDERNIAIGALQEEMNLWKDRALRSMAEMENTRRILTRDVQNAKKYGITGLAKSLLDVADNLDRALTAVPNEELEKMSEDPSHQHLVGLYEGVRATEKMLAMAFSKHGIVKFGKVHEAFNPNLHDAMFKVPMKDKDPGTIIEVLKVGYKLSDRVIRAAEVGVSAKENADNATQGEQ